MTTVTTAPVIDSDVHCAPASIDVLLPHLDDYWRDYVGQAGLKLSPSVGGAYPPGLPISGDPPADVAAVREAVLDRADRTQAILNCVTAFDASRNVYYEAALARALNDWLRSEWLDRDERLRASMVVPVLDPDAAVDEIERLAADRRFVQVLLPVRGDVPYGNRRFRGLLDAAARHDLVVGLHAWGRAASAPTPSGFTHSYLEDYLANSQVIVQAQVVSMVAEGVFDRLPSLRVALVECGFSWVVPMLWQFDKDWKALWREVPWLQAKPSEYVYRHFRATTAPAQLPRDAGEVETFVAMLKADRLLMFATDHPHDHGDGQERLLAALDEDGRRAVLHGNAAEMYGLG